MRNPRFNLVSFLYGVLAAWAIQMFTADITWNVVRPEQCGYMFPHSGRCKRPNHHPGNHY
jgi:hypothetical protein